MDGLNVYLYVGNNPINFIDPEGLVKWDESWNDAKAAEYKKEWLRTQTGQRKLREVESLEQKTKQEITVVWDPKSKDTARFDAKKLEILVTPNSHQYEAAVTPANPTGKGMSTPEFQLHHEMSHAELRLKSDSWLDYQQQTAEYTAPEMKKWRNPGEKYAVEETNKMQAERRKTEGDPDAYPDRVQYTKRETSVVVTRQGVWRNGKLEPVEAKQTYFKGIRVDLLNDGLRREMESQK